MNWLDIALVIVLIWAVRSSWDMGLIREGCTLAGIGFGIIIASQVYRPLAYLLFGQNANNLSYAFTLLLTLFSIVIGATAVGSILRETIHWFKLGWLDQLGGIAFGVLKGVIVIQIILIVFARFPVLNTDKLIQDSILADSLAQYAPYVMVLMPTEFHSLIGIIG